MVQSQNWQNVRQTPRNKLAMVDQAYSLRGGIGRIASQASSSKNTPRPYLKNNLKQERARDMTQVVECLPSKHIIFSLIREKSIIIFKTQRNLKFCQLEGNLGETGQCYIIYS
jgi:hypothetical protein